MRRGPETSLVAFYRSENDKRAFPLTPVLDGQERLLRARSHLHRHGPPGSRAMLWHAVVRGRDGVDHVAACSVPADASTHEHDPCEEPGDVTCKACRIALARLVADGEFIPHEDTAY